ncbi:hypothetical protein EJ997_10350 [Flaviflexus ciconiae]|uniref:Uncharacterized protein n=1 Tax=Flaviflexus ciconiae TaxID=2496867 RepID=A0A3S9PZB3_9ACTO|nr:hypothetical protein [Flaviflexus ciconiae]AZQ77684.1 hypothetical protein EJ997_10350 [Flaviflexus ciconiae]
MRAATTDSRLFLPVFQQGWTRGGKPITVEDLEPDGSLIPNGFVVSPTFPVPVGTGWKREVNHRGWTSSTAGIHLRDQDNLLLADLPAGDVRRAVPEGTVTARIYLYGAIAIHPGIEIIFTP